MANGEPRPLFSFKRIRLAISGEIEMQLQSRKLGGPGHLVVAALLSLLILGFAGTAHAAGQYVQVKYPASTAADELQLAVTYTIWIPNGVKTIRGVIVHQ